MIKEKDSKESHNKTTCNHKDPHSNLGLPVVQKGIVDYQSKTEAAPSSEKESSEFDDFNKQNSNKNSDNDRADQDYPSNPLLGVRIEEGRVEDDHHKRYCQNNSSQKDNWLKEASSKEVDNKTSNKTYGKENPFIAMNPGPNCIDINLWAGSARFERNLGVAFIRSINRRRSRRIGIRIACYVISNAVLFVSIAFDISFLTPSKTSVICFLVSNTIDVCILWS